MKKEQIDLCREIVKIFDKANFTYSGSEMIQASIRMINFGKMIQEAEKLLNAPLAPIAEPIEPLAQTKRRK